MHEVLVCGGYTSGNSLFRTIDDLGISPDKMESFLKKAAKNNKRQYDLIHSIIEATANKLHYTCTIGIEVGKYRLSIYSSCGKYRFGGSFQYESSISTITSVIDSLKLAINGE